MPSAVPSVIRPYRKLLRAVAELHVRGYQRLRIVPSNYEIGTWRCTILPAIHVSRSHGARWSRSAPERLQARYTSANENEYWGWRDEHHCTPSKLAEVFLERFPEIAELGYGEDWLYAGWYLHMLHLTYPGGLPLSWDNQNEPSAFIGHMGMQGGRETIPLPPPGHAAEESDL